MFPEERQLKACIAIKGNLFKPLLAKPPAGSSLLFGALADSARIKQRKNGSYKMVLKGVEEIDWFTDRPNRIAGEWSPKKLVKEWDVLFSDGAGAPNAQATFEIGSKRKLVTFEMFKPKLSDSNQTLSFKVRGIGDKNKDLLTGLRNKRLSDASLFIDDGTTGDSTVTMKVWNDSGLRLEMKSLSSNAIFGKPTEVSGYTDAELDGGDIFFSGGPPGNVDGAEGVFELPVTLKNGLKSPPIQVGIASGWCKRVPPEDLDNWRTIVDYSIDGGATQSVEATCGMIM